MEFMGYEIPQSMKGNEFFRSLYTQYQQKGKLSFAQENALRDMLDIQEDFYAYDYELPESMKEWEEDYNQLQAKIKRNRFKSVRGWNSCVRAIHSILECKPNQKYIDKALCKDFVPSYYRR